MSDERTIRIGIIGAGNNTRGRHIPLFREIPGVEIVTVCNRSEESSRKVADEFGIPRIEEKWQDVTSATDVDAVMIGTWPYLHAEASISALRNGKHVLTEARMAAHRDEAERMLAESLAHPGLTAQVVPAPMTLDVDPFVMDLIAAGTLGRLREVMVLSTNGRYASSDKPFHWRLDPDLSGVNIMALGILHETVLRWIDTDPEWVVADGKVFTERRTDPVTGAQREVRIPDSLDIFGRLSTGARLTYHLSQVEAGKGLSAICLNGDKACLRYDLAERGVYLAEVGGEERRLEVPEEKRRGWRVEQDFIDSIRTGAPVRLTSFRDGVRYMRFVDAVWRSCQQGSKKVTL